MSAATDLLIAYLRKATEQLAEVRQQRDDLRCNLRNMRISRDLWRERAKRYRLRAQSLKASRDHWRHRALTCQRGS